MLAPFNDDVFDTHLKETIGDLIHIGLAGQLGSLLDTGHKQIEIRQDLLHLGQPHVLGIPSGIHNGVFALLLAFLHKLGTGLAIESGQQHGTGHKDDVTAIHQLIGDILLHKSGGGSGVIHKAAFAAGANTNDGHGGAHRFILHYAGDIHAHSSSGLFYKRTEIVLADLAGKSNRHPQLRQIHGRIGGTAAHMGGHGIHIAERTRSGDTIRR